MKEVGLRKVEDKSGNANDGTEGLEAGIGRVGVEAAWVRKVMKPYHAMTTEVLQKNLHQCKAV